MAMVIPRSFSSGALSIWSKGVKSAIPFSDRTLVMAAVRVVLPWSMCPIVPMFTWGLFRSNFFLDMVVPLPATGERGKVYPPLRAGRPGHDPRLEAPRSERFFRRAAPQLAAGGLGDRPLLDDHHLE